MNDKLFRNISSSTTKKNKSNKGEQNLGKRNSTMCVVFYYKMSNLTDLQVQGSPSEDTSIRGQ